MLVRKARQTARTQPFQHLSHNTIETTTSNVLSPQCTIHKHLQAAPNERRMPQQQMKQQQQKTTQAQLRKL